MGDDHDQEDAEDRAQARAHDARRAPPGQLLELPLVTGVGGGAEYRHRRPRFTGSRRARPIPRRLGVEVVRLGVEHAAGRGRQVAGATRADEQRRQRCSLVRTWAACSTSRGRVRPTVTTTTVEVGGSEHGLALGAVGARRLEDDEVAGLDQRGEHGAQPVGDEELTALGGEPPTGEQAEEGIHAGLQQVQHVQPVVEQRLGQTGLRDS